MVDFLLLCLMKGNLSVDPQLIHRHGKAWRWSVTPWKTKGWNTTNMFMLQANSWDLALIPTLYIYIHTYIHMYDISIIYIYIWRFPKMEVPPVIIHFNGIFRNQPSSERPGYPHDLGTPMTWEPPYIYIHIPSGNLIYSYWKWPLIVDFPIKYGDFQ